MARNTIGSSRCVLAATAALAVLMTAGAALRAEPKNVILLIGDGMGSEHVKAAGVYATGAPGSLVFEALPYQGQVTTFSADNAITDSAAAATAMATGTKVNNGVISMAYPGSGSEIETLLERFQATGRSTGLVTTAHLTHATPAGFGAHEPSRNNLNEIGADYLLQTRPHVLLGGGGNGLTPQDAANAGYTVVTDLAGMLGIDLETETHVCGQFGTYHLPYEYDGVGALPHLSEMAATALSVLDNDPDGFFLMIEGGRIDHAAHDNDLDRVIPEVLEFDNTVQTVLDWASGRDDTLVLVTADHETGGLSVVTDSGQGSLPSVTWSTTGHSAANVPIYAWGNGAEKVTGVLDNTDVYHLAVEPSIELVSPADGGLLDSTQVSFLCRVSDAAGLSEASLYVAAPPRVRSFSGPLETRDAQIELDRPDTNFGSDLDISINVDGENPHAHAVLQFPALVGPGVDQVPAGSTIVSAQVRVYCTNLGNQLRAYRLTEDWLENEVTWNERTSGVPWSDPGADGSTSHADLELIGDFSGTGWRTVDITTFVQEWTDGLDNYGLVFLDSGVDGIDFDSSESANPPVLTVSYSDTDQEIQETVPLSGTEALVAFTPQILSDSQSFVWNCVVTNALGEQASPAQDFTFQIDTATSAPRVPALVGPADDATGVSLSPALEVLVDDPEGDLLEVTFHGWNDTAAPDFVVVALPDTQFYSESYPATFSAQTQWVVDQAAALNIAFVSHEGDLVENLDGVQLPEEWLRAQTSMRLLDGVVPYGFAPGNHDLPTTLYNQYFPYTYYESYPWYGGHYPADQNDNNYQLFSGGGEEFLVLHLTYDPAADVIAWADSVLKAHPAHKAIITTHAFLDSSGNRLSEAALIWADLVVPNENVYFVLCGHVSAEARRTDDIDGRKVHQLLADFQGRANGGDGWLRLLRFAPADDLVYVETYSPTLDQFEVDADSSFALEFPMSGIPALGKIENVTSGTTASLQWPGPELDMLVSHRWFVRITDPTGNVQTGPVWRFTTGSGDSDAPIISDIGVTVSDNTATVTWTTDELASSLVEYGLTTSYGSSESSAALVLDHSVSLSNLEQATTYHFRVTSVDAASNAASSEQTFTTSPGNHLPDAVDDAPTTDEDTVADISVLDNDSDPDSDPLTIVTFTDGAHGTVAETATGVLSFTPAADYYGIDSFDYTVSDGKGGSDTATVTVTILPVNDPPIAIDDMDVTDEDTAVTIVVLTNDSDVDGDTLSVESATVGSEGGSTLVNADGTVTYTPPDDFASTDAFSYTVNDGNGKTAVATVTVTVQGVNDPPVAEDDIATTAEDTPVAIAALGNDTDVDSASLSVIAITQGTIGDVSITATDTITYSPQSNQFGSDSFTYTVSDGDGGTDTATVTVTISAVVDVPGAPQDLNATAGDRSIDLSWTAGTDPDGVATGYNIYRATSSGAYVFTSPLDYVPETLTSYTDGGLQNDTTYYYVVKAVYGAGLESAASGEDFATPSDTLLDAYVTADPAITFGALGGDGITGTTAAGDGLVQTIQEGPNGRAGASSLDVEYALMTSADPTSVTGLELHLAATWAPDGAGDPLNISIWNGGDWEDISQILVSGSLVLTASPENYVDGTGAIRVRMTDTAAVKKESKETLTVDLLYAHVTATNAPPVGVADSYFTQIGETLDVSAAEGVLANDSDPEGSPLTAALDSATMSGSVLTLASDGSFSYTPASGYTGQDAFTYIANDGANDSSVVNVTITISAPNNAPLATADAYDTSEDVTLVVPAVSGVLANDSDADNDPLTAVLVNPPAHGELTFADDGSFTYTPDPDFNSSDEFTYRAQDLVSVSDVATVTIDVIAANDAPAATTDTYTMAQDDSLSVAAPGVLANDTDVDGDTLTVALVSNVGSGTLTLRADGSFDYSPTSGFSGSDSFTYVASDGVLSSTTTSVTITVTPAGGDTVHVQSIDMSLVPTGKNTKALATVTIEPALQNATVTGDWLLDGAILASGVSALTAATGAAELASPPEKVKGGEEFTFQVTAITLAGHTYAPDENLVTEASITVP